VANPAGNLRESLVVGRVVRNKRCV
jgi:hypothetical protein